MPGRSRWNGKRSDPATGCVWARFQRWRKTRLGHHPAQIMTRSGLPRKRAGEETVRADAAGGRQKLRVPPAPGVGARSAQCCGGSTERRGPGPKGRDRRRRARCTAPQAERRHWNSARAGNQNATRRWRWSARSALTRPAAQPFLRRSGRPEPGNPYAPPNGSDRQRSWG